MSLLLVPQLGSPASSNGSAWCWAAPRTPQEGPAIQVITEGGAAGCLPPAAPVKARGVGVCRAVSSQVGMDSSETTNVVLEKGSQSDVLGIDMEAWHEGSGVLVTQLRDGGLAAASGLLCVVRACAMHTPCTRHAHAHAAHTPCARRAHAVHMPCTCSAHAMHTVRRGRGTRRVTWWSLWTRTTVTASITYGYRVTWWSRSTARPARRPKLPPGLSARPRARSSCACARTCHACRASHRRSR